MDILVGGEKFSVDSEICKEFTNLSVDEPHNFPDENPTDFRLLLDFLTVPEGRRLASLNLSTFLKLRHFALDMLGLKTLNACFQTTFLEMIQRPNSKKTADALAFQGRGFATVEEEKYVDRSIRRFKKKLTPIQLELVKAQ
jgi:hypothetical protein